MGIGSEEQSEPAKFVAELAELGRRRAAGELTEGSFKEQKAALLRKRLESPAQVAPEGDRSNWEAIRMVCGPLMALALFLGVLAAGGWTAWSALTGKISLLAAAGIFALLAPVLWLGLKLGGGPPVTLNEIVYGSANEAIACPHCGAKGGVRTRRVSRKKGLSGGKTAAAILTGGVSILATGLSRREAATAMHCDNCGLDWDL